MGDKPIWINGANTPWHLWNEFGSSFDANWWTNHFQTMRGKGMNATRVWISCDGQVGINIDANGMVSGASDLYWSHLDSFFQIAKANKIYVNVTLMSFDHFKAGRGNFQSWRNLINSDANIDSYIKNFLTPLLTRYRDNPYLWSFDLLNEPEWASNSESGGSLAWDNLEHYFARAALTIHANSAALVTVGMGVIKYNSDQMNGNKVSDAALQEKVNDSAAKLDFYSVHWYSWMENWWPNPMYTPPNKFGLDGTKPAIIGEVSAHGTTGHTLLSDFEAAHTNGWQGIMPWTSNGVDSNGGINEVSPAIANFFAKYPLLVFPQ